MRISGVGGRQHAGRTTRSGDRCSPQSVDTPSVDSWPNDEAARNVLDLGKRNILGVQISAIDYEAAVARIIAAARSVSV